MKVTGDQELDVLWARGGTSVDPSTISHCAMGAISTDRQKEL